MTGVGWAPADRVWGWSQPCRVPCFGPATGLGPAAAHAGAGHALWPAITGVRIVGVQPSQLGCVELRHHGAVVYRLDSGKDARGNTFPAGEMVLAMAQMQGESALVIDVRLLELQATSTVLRLWLPIAAAAWSHQVQVQVLWD